MKHKPFTEALVDDFRPRCLHCQEPIHTDGQSQGWMHNACVNYPLSDTALAFKAAQERRRAMHAHYDANGGRRHAAS